jgi:hypothetical protein
MNQATNKRQRKSKNQRLREKGQIDINLLLPCIYKATSRTTGKSYIGLSEDGMYIRRLKHYRRFKNHNYGSKNRFYPAIVELGWADFEWETVFVLTDQSLSLGEIVDILNQKEIEFVAKYDSYNQGYNDNRGGGHRIPQDYSGLTLEEKLQIQREKYLRARKVKRSTQEYKERYNARQNAKREFEKENNPLEYRQKVQAKRNKYKAKKNAYHKTREWLDKHNIRRAKRRAAKKGDTV